MNDAMKDVIKELRKQARNMDKMRTQYPDDPMKRRYYLGKQDG